ncbi:MAG: hypothetical protein Q8M88_08335, partial [Phenylobacterium sp.]|uniref:hypothetical protein n=1 Tax=Phenylobacterium sp. TaxID=1871053 RepID=UPI00273289A0
MTSQRSAGLMGPGGVLFAAALTLGAIALSWLSLSHAMAEAQADADPAAALHWRGHNARALAAASEQKLQSLDGGVAEAAALARAALRYGPLQSTPLRTLALAAVRQKQEAAAQRFMAQAALRTRRDPLAQSWLLERAHARGDYAQTIVRADAIMRLDAEMTASLFALINDVAARPGGEAPVAASLAARPPWRADYLRQLVAQPGG